MPVLSGVAAKQTNGATIPPLNDLANRIGGESGCPAHIWPLKMLQYAPATASGELPLGTVNCGWQSGKPFGHKKAPSIVGANPDSADDCSYTWQPQKGCMS